MKCPMYHRGEEIFHTFDLSVESEITYADYCKEMIFPRKDAIRFTSDAFLLVHPTQDQEDWVESKEITFFNWENILGIQNISGGKIIAEIDQDQLRKWCATLSVPEANYPCANIREGNLTFMFAGQPRSFRSRGGKSNFKEQVEKFRSSVMQHYQTPTAGNVEMHVDIFSSDLSHMPDVDRLSSTIMDAFQGLVYQDDKQVKCLNPRIFDSSKALTKLECRAEPMPYFQVQDIPLAAMFPLATGITDYYVVRIYPVD